MTLEELIKELSLWLEKYPKAKVTFNLEVGARKSVLLWSIYPEVYEDGGDTFIVISNKHLLKKNELEASFVCKKG